MKKKGLFFKLIKNIQIIYFFSFLDLISTFSNINKYGIEIEFNPIFRGIFYLFNQNSFFIILIFNILGITCFFSYLYFHFIKIKRFKYDKVKKKIRKIKLTLFILYIFVLMNNFLGYFLF